MQDVRTITAKHETKRRAVLDELQSLASRICAFPSPRQPMPDSVTHNQGLGRRKVNAGSLILQPTRERCG